MKTKLLFICSSNLDRSPCAEALFKNSGVFEAKSAGVGPFAEIKVSSEAVAWADIIFVMDERNERHKSLLIEQVPEAAGKDIRILNVSNEFCRNDSELERLLKSKLEKEGFLYKNSFFMP